jgi:hypothetical protein
VGKGAGRGKAANAAVPTIAGNWWARRIAAETAAIRLFPPYELCSDHETSLIQSHRNMF